MGETAGMGGTPAEATGGSGPVRCSEEVSDALADGRAVVALESTIIAHGLPTPLNLETAMQAEEAVRAGGAVPATVAILDGRIRVGLSGPELERIASAGDVAKASLRDVGWVMAGGGAGATTVATTMLAAHLAGIRVFSTGGIGGVHRGGTLDESADLTALGRTPVAVVCAGAKAILDVPGTLERLETLGVPVVGYGTDEFPGFWTRGTGLPVTVRADDPGHTAAILEAHWSTGMVTGVVVAVPVPAGSGADPAEVEAAIGDGIQTADRAGVSGRDVTPFLLAHVADATGGDTLGANVALVLNNAGVAARVSAALSGSVGGS